MVTAHEALWSKYNFDSKIESVDGNIINSYTGSPKSSLLYFISLYFGTIELVKQITETKIVSLNLIHCFHTCCAIFWLEYSICVLPRQRCLCRVYFPATYFLYFIARIARTPSLYFVNITKDKPLDAKSSARWEQKHVYFDLVAYLC